MFVFGMVYMLEGLMFLNRVLLVIWFDFDYVEKTRGWVQNMKDHVKSMLDRLSKKKMEREEKIEREIKEASKLVIIDEGDCEDVNQMKEVREFESNSNNSK